jgi:hypothetical protein
MDLVSRRSARSSALSEIQDSFQYVGTSSDVTKLCNGRICIKGRGDLEAEGQPLTSLEVTVIRPDVTVNHGRAKAPQFADSPHPPKWNFTLTLAVGVNFRAATWSGSSTFRSRLR